MSDLTNQLATTISLGVDVDKEDVLAIYVSKQEDELKMLRDSANRLEESHSKSIDKFEKQLKKLLDDECRGFFLSKAEALKTCFAAMGKNNTSYKLSHGYNESARSEDETVVEFTCEFKVNSRSSYMDTIEFNQQHVYRGIKMGEVNNILNAIEMTKQERSEARRKSLDYTAKLRDIPTIERKARADIARYTLNQSEAGKQLLEGLE